MIQNKKIKWENKMIQRYNEKIKWYNDVEMKWYKYEKIKWYKDSSRSMLVRNMHYIAMQCNA